MSMVERGLVNYGEVFIRLISSKCVIFIEAIKAKAS